jgi:hypothetical protein
MNYYTNLFFSCEYFIFAIGVLLPYIMNWQLSIHKQRNQISHMNGNYS